MNPMRLVWTVGGIIAVAAAVHRGGTAATAVDSTVDPSGS